MERVQIKIPVPSTNKREQAGQLPDGLCDVFIAIDRTLRCWAAFTCKWRQFTILPQRERELELTHLTSTLVELFSSGGQSLDALAESTLIAFQTMPSSFGDSRYPDFRVFQDKKVVHVPTCLVRFRPHLRQVDSKHFEDSEILQEVLSELGSTIQDSPIEEGICAFADDIPCISAVALGWDESVQTNNDAFHRLASLGDHLERHCDLAKSELNALIANREREAHGKDL
jgi:hypothetical protein